ncbi:MAG: pyridoxamine 5'-phosphate oxidase [Solirubrobacterales bacterium]|nr:pyridoxamine 5'-phosphate oxidase [Solirubrobacterales bacterium]
MRRSYARGGLDEAALAPTWLEQLRVWLGEAAELLEPNAMVLATADARGRPSARTVLLKGLDERGLTFFTNLDSRKGRDLRENPYASVVFPWVELQRQVVVAGEVAPVPPEESDAYFASRPYGSRVGAAASPQSQVIASRSELEAVAERLAAEHPEDVPRPPHWGGLRLAPETVEFWQGREDRLHDRLRYRRTAEGGWVVERLAP